ncbi:hypothetical protein D3C76_676630 [compost metagenome]
MSLALAHHIDTIGEVHHEFFRQTGKQTGHFANQLIVLHFAHAGTPAGLTSRSSSSLSRLMGTTRCL